MSIDYVGFGILAAYSIAFCLAERGWFEDFLRAETIDELYDFKDLTRHNFYKTLLHIDNHFTIICCFIQSFCMRDMSHKKYVGYTLTFFSLLGITHILSVILMGIFFLQDEWKSNLLGLHQYDFWYKIE